VLKSNHLELAPEAILGSYLQLQEVERACRLVKSFLKIRPIYHRRERRVKVHICITCLAVLLAKTLCRFRDCARNQWPFGQSG